MSKIKSNYAESWLPVKNINNGMIELDNKQFVTGVKIIPRNIFILDQNTQDNILIALKNFYNIIDFEFWLMSVDRPVDIMGYLSTLQILYNETQNVYARKLITQDIDKANMFMSENVTDIEYYILFKDKNTDILQKRIRTVIMGLNNCGLNAIAVSNKDLRAILDGFLNDGIATNYGTVLS